MPGKSMAFWLLGTSWTYPNHLEWAVFGLVDCENLKSRLPLC
jgi:hypothetical protein